MPLFWILLFFLFLPNKSFAQKLILFTPDEKKPSVHSQVKGVDNPYGKVKAEKIFTVAYGQPAFANFLDFAPPERAFLLTQNGSVRLTPLRKEIFDPWFNKPRIAYSLALKPDLPGDYILCIETKNMIEPGDVVRKHFAKTVFHVEKEKGWDRLCGFDLEIKPYTRPYGLVSNVVFWGRVLYQGEPISEGTITVERLRVKPLEKLPKLRTGEINFPVLQKTTLLREDGSFFVSFEEEGWWVVSFTLRRGVITYGNQEYPFELSTHLWVYVFPQEEDKAKQEEHRGKKKRLSSHR